MTGDVIGNKPLTNISNIQVVYPVVDSNTSSDWAGDTWLTDTSKNWTPWAFTGKFIQIEDGLCLEITGNSETVLYFSGNTDTGLKAYKIFNTNPVSDDAISVTINGETIFSVSGLGIRIFADNAAAVAAGMTTGMLYRTNTDPSHLCIVI